ncbi:MAG: hypothetical protein ACP5I1_00980, partial [Candidatus Hinthialibacter sp.]
LLEAEPDLMGTIHSEALRRHFENFVIHKDASGQERVAQFRISGGN